MLRWFRSNMRWGVGCALFALALQVALTLTHVHVNGIGPRSAAALAVALADAPAEPANPHPMGVAGDFCAICAQIHLTGSLLPAATPSLPLPVTLSPLRQAIGTDRNHAASPPPLFQARAPPVA